MKEPYCSNCNNLMEYEEAPLVPGANGPMLVVEPCCCPEDQDEILATLKEQDTDFEVEFRDGLEYLNIIKRDLGEFMEVVFEVEDKNLHEQADELINFELELSELEIILRRAKMIIEDVEELKEDIK